MIRSFRGLIEKLINQFCPYHVGHFSNETTPVGLSTGNHKYMTSTFQFSRYLPCLLVKLRILVNSFLKTSFFSFLQLLKVMVCISLLSKF